MKNNPLDNPALKLLMKNVKSIFNPLSRKFSFPAFANSYRLMDEISTYAEIVAHIAVDKRI